MNRKRERGSEDDEPEPLFGLLMGKRKRSNLSLSRNLPPLQSQAPSQAQGSSGSSDSPKRHTAEPSSARFDRPDPSKPAFGISKPEHLQAAVASLADWQYQRQQQGSSQGLAESSQSTEAGFSSSHLAAGSSQGREPGSFQRPFEITGDPPTVVLSHGQDAPNAFGEALNGMKNSSYNESIRNCKRGLSFYKLEICANNVSDIMNGKSPHSFEIKANEASVTPKGYLLLYCLCQALKIQVYVFSSRKHPIVIRPGSGPFEHSMALLVHRTGIFTKCWFFLCTRDPINANQM
ncbi:hypothetical protein [Parasitella parasitica]|uniref:Uncharacterized protein n=1 Tax=Parasitella parasitica TaxID=35722 RepID=A0A0B7NVQ2_9FUNG|nr:hypothetical protein [Parasitella parasitica]